LGESCRGTAGNGAMADIDGGYTVIKWNTVTLCVRVMGTEVSRNNICYPMLNEESPVIYIDIGGEE
jgi:hypothetical protein